MNDEPTIIPKIRATLPKTPPYVWTLLCLPIPLTGFAIYGNISHLVRHDMNIWLLGFLLVANGGVLIYLVAGLADAWRYNRYVRGVERKIEAELQDLLNKAVTITAQSPKAKKGN